MVVLRLSVIGLLICLLSIWCQGQAENNPISVCLLFKNPAKFKNKDITVSGTISISAETSPFQPEKDCSEYEAITVGFDDNYKRLTDPQTIEAFEQASDLDSAIRRDHPGMVSRFCCAMRITLVAEGKFLVSKKPKYGHLNGYKYAFLIKRLLRIDSSRLVGIGDKDNFEK